MRNSRTKKFNPGDRVKPSESSLKMQLEKPTTIGTVVWISKLRPDMIDVLRDGRKTRIRYHQDFWEKIEESKNE